MSTATSEEIDNLKILLAIDEMYHSARAGWFHRLHCIMMYMTIVLGAAAVTALAPITTGIAVVACAAFDICFDLSGKEQRHLELRRRFIYVRTDFERDHFSPTAYDRAKAARAEIAEEEPPIYRGIERSARAQAMVSFGRVDTIPPMTRWERLTRHVFRQEGWLSKTS